VSGRAEAVGRGIRCPRDRHAAAVTAVALAVRAEPGRVLTGVAGDVDGLGQAELLALVEVGGAGEAEHQGGRGAGAAQADLGDRLAGGVRSDAVTLRV